MIYRQINIEKDAEYYVTIGLRQHIDKELKIAANDNGVEVKVLEYLIDYILDSNPVIMGEQTISFHSWILKFIETSDGCFALHEASKHGVGYVQGVDYAIQVWQEQLEECWKNGVSPAFPVFTQTIVISKGVYEGLPVEAIRYPSSPDMTGWWLITDLYDDNISSLQNVHFYHVAFARPELLRFLALPFGFRFKYDGKENNIRFDEEIIEGE